MRPDRSLRERTGHAAIGAEDEPLGAAAAGAEPDEPGPRQEAAAAGLHFARGGLEGGGGSAAGGRR